MTTEPSRRLDAALRRIDGWLETRTDAIDPYRWEEPGELLLRRKAFCEVGLLLYVRSGWGEDVRGSPLHDRVIAGVSHPAYAALVRRSPRHFLLYAAPALYAKQAGRLPESLAAAVRQALAAPAVVSTERVPHRVLELWHFCRAYGVEMPNSIPLESILSLGCVGNPLDPIQSTVQDAYALTHSVFYLTNFGIPSPAFPDPTPVLNRYPTALLDALALRHLGSANMDVALELLLAGCLLGRLSRPVAELITRWAIEVVDAHGTLKTGPSVESEDFVRSRPEEADWAESYHTVLVASMALRAMRARREELPDEPGWSDEDGVRLAAGLARLADYDLPQGAAYLAPLLNREPAGAYRAVLLGIREFVLSQRGEDGHFGWLADERTMFDRQRPGGSFSDEVQRDIDVACGSLLASLESLYVSEKPTL